MIRSELAWVMRAPIPCGNCGKESLEIVARLVKVTDRTCDSCGSVLNLDTEEWAAFRDSLKEFCIGKNAPIAPVKK